MILVRALDTDNDWSFGQGTNDYKSANPAVAQLIQTNLNMFQGDCFFDSGFGVDWFNLLGGKDQLSLNLSVSAIILNTHDVLSITQLFIQLNTDRSLSISYQTQTSYSTVSATTQISI